MRICLINPPNIAPREWDMLRVFQPLGLAYLAAVLERRHKVSLTDALAQGGEMSNQLMM